MNSSTYRRPLCLLGVASLSTALALSSSAPIAAAISPTSDSAAAAQEVFGDERPVIDTDESRSDPVAHRYLHGTFGDADFQLALPAEWNGRLLVSTRGFSGDEFQNDEVYKQIALRHGYAYAASDEGWNRYTIVDEPEDRYYESRARLVQLTQFASEEAERWYGGQPWRTYLAGGSNGGHHTKWLVEDFPTLYDGGVSMYGYNSGLEMWGAFPVFLRNYDVIESRISDIIAARAQNREWNPATDALDPALTDEQIQALQAIYNIPARLGSGFTFNAGRAPGSEQEWPGAYSAMIGYLRDSVGEFEPGYDPDGNGELSLDELKTWDPHEASPDAQHEMRLLDVSGELQRPIIVGHGTADTIVTPNAARAYEELARRVLGDEQAEQVLRTYFIPGMGHGGAAVYPFVEEALASLDRWVTYRMTKGTAGALPGRIIGLEPAAGPIIESSADSGEQPVDRR